MTLHGRVRLIGITVAFALCLPAMTEATTYARTPSPCEMFTAPDVVIFRGTVQEVTPETMEPSSVADEPPDSQLRVRISADEPIRHAPGETLDVFTTTRRQAYEALTVGESYLVYARRYEQQLHLSHRVPLRDARVELEILRELSLGVVPASRLYGAVRQRSSALNGQYLATVEGRRLPGVTVFAKAGDAEYQVTTDVDGSFVFIGLAPGHYSVRAETSPLLEPYSFLRGFTADLDTCAATVNVNVIARSVTGTVRRNDGTPAPGASVVVVDADHLTRARSTDTLSGDDGFRIDGLPDGRYLIGVNLFQPPTARSPYPPTWYPGSRDPRRAQVIVLRDEKPVEVDMVLPPPLPVRTIQGRVIETSGQPVHHAMVCLIDEEFPNQVECRDFTDVNGEFSVDTVVGRRVRAKASELNPPRESEEVEVFDGNAYRALTLVLSKRLPDLVIP